MKIRSIGFIICSIILFSCSEEKSVTEPMETVEQFKTAQQVLPEVMRGINIGNTLEPPTEGGWNNGPLQEYYFDDYKAAGFTCVRVPIRWEEHTLEQAPYTVDESWMQRVEQVVDWGLERDLYIIINAHHDWWLVNNYAQETVRNRFKSIWTQVSERFKDKSPRLMFEVINEPKGLTQQEINELNSEVMTIIRATNPQRIIIFGGHEWAGAPQLLTVDVPNDNYVIGYFHTYDPWNFAGEGNGVWGSQDDVAAIRNVFESVAAWSLANNVPAMISEFGAITACDYNSRMFFYSVYVEQALRNNIAFQAWDDGGNFGIYERDDRKWPEVKDILIGTYTDGPATLQALNRANSSIGLTWQNRSSNQSAIRIERKDGAGEFMSIAVVAANATEYVDEALANGTYVYRIVYEQSSGAEKFSYPVMIERI